MTCCLHTVRRLADDQTGQASLEWLLVVTVFGLPFLYFVILALNQLAEHYRMVTFVETLPFP